MGKSSTKSETPLDIGKRQLPHTEGIPRGNTPLHAIRVPAEVWSRWQAAAREREVSLTELIRAAVTEYLS